MNTAVVLTELQQEVQALRATCEAQQQELDALRTRLAQRQPQGRSSILDVPTPESQPKVLRPMDYWVDHVPDYGDALTPDDLARQRRRPSATPPWNWQTIVQIVMIAVVVGATAILHSTFSG